LAVAVALRFSGQDLLRSKASPGANSKASGPSVFVVRGLDGGLMSDLWNFPGAFGRSPSAALSRLSERLSTLGIGALLGPELARIRHAVTYRDIQVRVYSAEIAEAMDEGIRWLALSRFDDSAVSQLARKIAAALPKSERLAFPTRNRQPSFAKKPTQGNSDSLGRGRRPASSNTG
jgi:hypothetical protein